MSPLTLTQHLTAHLGCSSCGPSPSLCQEDQGLTAGPHSGPQPRETAGQRSPQRTPDETNEPASCFFKPLNCSLFVIKWQCHFSHQKLCLRKGEASMFCHQCRKNAARSPAGHSHWGERQPDASWHLKMEGVWSVPRC